MKFFTHGQFAKTLHDGAERICEKEGDDITSPGLHATGIREVPMVNRMLGTALDKLKAALVVKEPTHVYGAMFELITWVYVVGIHLGYDLDQHSEEYIAQMMATLKPDDSDETHDEKVHNLKNIDAMLQSFINFDRIKASDPANN